MYKSLLIFLIMPAFTATMQKEGTQEPAQQIVPEIIGDLENMSERLQLLFIPSDTDGNESGSDLTIAANRRKSLCVTQTDIWGTTIAAGGNFFNRAAQLIEPEKFKQLSVELQEQNMQEAQKFYVRAINLYISGYYNGHQKEALVSIRDTLPHIIIIERKNFEKCKQLQELYAANPKCIEMKDKVLRILEQEKANRQVTKEQRRASATITSPAQIIKTPQLPQNPQEKKIADKFIMAKKIFQLANAARTNPVIPKKENGEKKSDEERKQEEYENCQRGVRLCYDALKAFFNIYECNQSSEVLEMLEQSIEFLRSIDSWMAVNAKDKYVIEPKFVKTAEAIRAIRKKREDAQPFSGSSQETSPRLIVKPITWQEALRASAESPSKPRIAAEDRKESPLRFLEKLIKKS